MFNGDTYRNLAKKIAKIMNKEEKYTVADLPKLLAKSGEAAMHSQQNALIADELREMGYKIEESYIKRFESFSGKK
jgi:hypothetical protein